jgi:hypothetical protein
MRLESRMEIGQWAHILQRVAAGTAGNRWQRRAAAVIDGIQVRARADVTECTYTVTGFAGEFSQESVFSSEAQVTEEAARRNASDRRSERI